MRVRVGYTFEDRVGIKQPIESIDIYIDRENEQQERNRDGEPAPGRWGAVAA